MREGWREARLGDVLQEISRPVLVVDLNEVRYAGVRWYAEGVYAREAVPAAGVKARSLTVLRAGDITYNRMWATKASFGIAHSDVDGCHVTNDFPIFSARAEAALVDYIELVFLTSKFQAEAAARATGTTERRRLNQRDFLTIPVAVPPLAEQRRIVDLIAAVDDAIEAAEGEARSSAVASEHLRRSLFSSLANTPSRPASEMFDMLLGRQKSERQSIGDHVIPYVRSGNLGSGVVSGSLHMMNFEPREQEKYGLQHGDVLLVEGGTIGASARWQQSEEGVVGFDKHVIRLRGVAGRSTSDFAHEWVRYANAEGIFDRAATGITIRALGFGRASALPVPSIDLATQDQFVRTLAPIEAAADAARAHAESLHALRSNLLTVLLSGEHEIPESYDHLLDLAGEGTAA